MTAKPGRLLRIHILESDLYQGKPLLEAIMTKCREVKIAGSTVFRGLEGYGESAELHRAHLVARDQPIVITIVDTAENPDRLDWSRLSRSGVERPPPPPAHRHQR